MDPRRRASLLWGLVGAFAFLVLAQGYRLIRGPSIGLPPLLGVALVVFIGASIAAHLAGRYLDGKRQV
ncbi:MAG: hypothetical protein ABEI31_09070 [Halodesulfurarchaeum sp.]